MDNGNLSLIVSLTPEELARALQRGTLVIPLSRAAGADGAEHAGSGALDEATVARVCGAYGPESLAANLLWEIAQAGDDGIDADALKEALGLKGSKALAGVFSGLGKTLARELPGREHLFIARTWRRAEAQYHYRMPAVVRRVVARVYG
ncbi:MAG TPA: hypothetical protein VFO61_00060 [Alphaproteobacteria bacterium]|nr:hypothetical protein [Alphaproteobacteria bacterium]